MVGTAWATTESTVIASQAKIWGSQYVSKPDSAAAATSRRISSMLSAPVVPAKIPMRMAARYGSQPPSRGGRRHRSGSADRTGHGPRHAPDRASRSGVDGAGAVAQGGQVATGPYGEDLGADGQGRLGRRAASQVEAH